MRLNQMFTNVLSLSLEELIIKVEKDASTRALALHQSMSKIDISPKKRDTIVLSDEEKAILKALGLSKKDLKVLKECTNE